MEKEADSEKNLQEAVIFQQRLIDALPVPVFYKDAEGRYLGCNRSFEKYFGQEREQITGKSVYEISPKEIADIYHEQDLALLRNPGIQIYETTVKDTNRVIHNVIFHKATFPNTDGSVGGLIGAILDITESKRVEEALRESEELFRSYLEYAPDGVYMSDLEGTFLYGNRKCEEISGYRREELIGKNLLVMNLLSENSLNKAVRLIQANVEGKSTGPDEIDLINKEGRIIPVEINTNVVQRMGQRIILAFVRDITERKLAEESLRESEEKFSKAFQTSPYGITITNPKDGKFIEVNDAFISITGFTRGEALAGSSVGMKLWTNEDDRQRVVAALQAGKAVVNQELQFRTKSGEVIMGLFSAQMIQLSRGLCILSSINDITERKRAEKQLQDALENLRKAFSATIQVMVSAVEARDPYTAGHQIRSADLARAIAKEMGLPQEKIEGIRMAGAIHDIGKLSVPAEILSKSTKLTEIEFSLIKEHSLKGYEMLGDLESPWPLAQIIYQHHERMDGSGYPRNLKGDEILMEARILAVADVVESMASHRPYRPALGIHAALEEIEKNRGTLYDEAVADACLRLFREKGFQLEEA
jgi:PAS domain S-box-containing protein